MTAAAPRDWNEEFFQGHAPGHGVRAFDGDLGKATPTGRGRIEIRRTPDGRYYALVNLDTAIGHLCAAVHLERHDGASLIASGGDDPSPERFDLLSDRLADVAARLELAAKDQGASAETLKAALLVVRAHVGDTRAKAAIRQLRVAASRGSQGAAARLATLRQAREWARAILSDRTVTGDIFGDIGNAVSNAAKGIGHDFDKAASDIGHAIQPALDSIKQWGPEVLSDVQGLVSMIPGIGTGISAAISAGLALLKGGSPLEVAIEAAYGAIPIPPGIRPICDTVLDTVLQIIKNPHDLMADALQVARDRLPSGLPQQVFDTLIRLVGHSSPPTPAPHAVAAHAVARYTHGLGPALQRGLPRLSPPVQAHLARLPDPHTQFQSIHQIAPHFTVDPKIAGPLVAHANAAAAAKHGIKPAPPVVQAQQTAAVAQAAVTHAQTAAQMRLAQANFEAPRDNSTPSPASIAVEVSPDGSQSRVVASDALSHVAPAVAPS